MTLADEQFTSQRNRRKKIRTVAEVIVLVVLLYIIVNALFVFGKYEPFNFNNTEFGSDEGFIAISYFGVDRTGTNTLIGKEQLEHHLEVLKKNGYVTITGKDVQDYYNKGKALPKHSLYLNFEDGRKDTAVFAEKMLEKFNFHATVSTYAENLRNNDNKFLKPPELREFEKHGYWEMGSNGYRLYYINVFDRWHHYLGNMNPLVYTHLTSVLGREYNHYLMDYIRDDKDFPVESYQAMKDRVTDDYTMLRDIYIQDLGYVPEAYTLMHANTGYYGNNDDVSKVNEQWLRKLFKFTFNREGYCHNLRNSSIYDLTRMEPRSYWPANHLLMRIKYDGVPDIKFEPGDENQYKDWLVEKGAAEFRDETIILTTLPKEKAIMKLKNSQDFRNLRLTADIKGNQYGTQAIHLRADDAMANRVSVLFRNNHLIVEEAAGTDWNKLADIDLFEFDGNKYLSVDEDKKEVAIKEREILGRYAPDTASARKQLSILEKEWKRQALSVEEGGAPFIPRMSYHARMNRKLDIRLQDDKLHILIDGKEAVKDLAIERTGSGSLFLEATWPDYGYSQTNLADDVYDGVFSGLKVEGIVPGKGEAPVLYDVHYTGVEKYKRKVKHSWEKLLDWILANF
ncbi:MAG: glycoside hydrolase [Acidaminococcaceae bacterium]|nr:glycoside hydrolase [Acidaminococcaceae bacterium]